MRTHKLEHMHTHTKQKLKELNSKPDMHTIIYGQFHGPFPVKLICKEILLWANIPGDLHLVEADRVGLTGRNACFITGLQWGARLMIVVGVEERTVVYRYRFISFFPSHKLYLFMGVRHMGITQKMSCILTSGNQYEGRL